MTQDLTWFMRILRSPILAATPALLVLCCAPSTYAESVNFEGLEHGRIVNTQFAAQGLTISVDNIGGGPDLAIVFDSQETSTADPDLEGPTWSGGNLAPDTVLGNLLIIAENSSGSGDGIVDSPDDEGSSPAGSMTFDFAAPITEFGFDFIDVDDQSDYEITFFSEGSAVATVEFDDFTTSGDPFFDSTVSFGDHTANRISPITVAALNSAFGLGLTAFDQVVVDFGGSGAIDNLNWVALSDQGSPVPEPTSLALLAFGSALVLARTRRRKTRH